MREQSEEIWQGNAHLEHIVLCAESEVLASDGESDIGHFRDLLALHQRLGGCEDGQSVAQGVQLRNDLLLCLVVGQRYLQEMVEGSVYFAQSQDTPQQDDQISLHG